MFVVSAITHLLDDPVHDRLEGYARRLIAESGHLLTRLQVLRAGRGADGIGEAAGPRLPLVPSISVTEFKARNTGLERESIHAMGKALERVSKTIEKCERRLPVMPGGTAPLDLTGQAAMLVEATRLLAALVSRLRSLTELERAKDLLEQIQVCESECGRLGAESLAALYAGQFEPGKLCCAKRPH